MNVIEKNKNKDSNNLAIEGDMTIQNIAECKDEILKLLDNKKDVVFDLSNVGRIDTSGFQLLISIKVQMEKNNKKLKIKTPSTDIKRIFTLYQEDLKDYK